MLPEIKKKNVKERKEHAEKTTINPGWKCTYQKLKRKYQCIDREDGWMNGWRV